ncbi:MAG: glycoside hydrolase [Verrucomicrobiaceae bacterium]|nr:MAG: glycoside hydrolase [Verrucomicrobiaceae bacterium]
MKCISFIIALILLRVPLAVAGEKAWDDVRTWVYQLCDYKDGKLDEIAGSGFDLAVVDLSREGGSDYFTREEIEKLKASGTLVLAYFEIGAIEEGRPEWGSVPVDLKAGSVDGWPTEQYVKFWDDKWWPVVKGRVDRALDAGFDGAYLDMITTYEEIPGSDMMLEQRANAMVDLIVRISRYAKEKNPAFRIVPQNCPELYTWTFAEPKPNRKYLDAIDGIGIESVFYIAHDKPAKQAWCEENRQNALAIKRAGKMVFGIDYAKKSTCIADAYKKLRAIGFVPYVSVRELNVIVPEKP